MKTRVGGEKVGQIDKAKSFKDLQDVARAGLIPKGVGKPLGDLSRRLTSSGLHFQKCSRILRGSRAKAGRPDFCPSSKEG